MLNIAIDLVFILIGSMFSNLGNLGNLLLFCLLALYIIEKAFFIVKRLHDLGRPGFHYWLLLIPIYNFYLALVLLLKRGIQVDSPTLNKDTVVNNLKEANSEVQFSVHTEPIKDNHQHDFQQKEIEQAGKIELAQNKHTNENLQKEKIMKLKKLKEKGNVIS